MCACSTVIKSRVWLLVLLAGMLVVGIRVDSARAANRVDVDVGFGLRGVSVGTKHLPATASQYRVAYGEDFIQRFLADGRLDRGFATNGTLEVSRLVSVDHMSPLLIDNAGRVTVLLGDRIVRYAPNGRANDPSFGTGGIVSLADLGVPDDVRGVGLLGTKAGATIVIMGGYATGAFVARLDAEGRRDESFAVQGMFAAQRRRAPSAAALLPSGELVLATWSIDCPCAMMSVLDGDGHLRDEVSEPNYTRIQRIRPMSTGGWLFAGAEFDTAGPSTFEVAQARYLAGMVGADGNIVRSHSFVRYSDGASSLPNIDDIAQGPGHGYVLVGRVTDDRLFESISTTTLGADFRPTSSLLPPRSKRPVFTFGVRPTADIGRAEHIDVPRVVGQTFDVRAWRADRSDGQLPGVRAVRMRMRTGVRHRLQGPAIRASWPRSHYVLSSRLSVPFRVRRGGRSIVAIEASRWGRGLSIAGRVLRMPLGDGAECAVIAATDSMGVGASTSRCFVRPGVPDDFARAQGCTLQRDRIAYLGRSLRCGRTGSSVRLDASGDRFVLVLRTCPSCGIVRVRSYYSRRTRDVISRTVDLNANTRGRRIVAFDVPKFADRADLRVLDGRRSGVTIEGHDQAYER